MRALTSCLVSEKIKTTFLGGWEKIEEQKLGFLCRRRAGWLRTYLFKAMGSREREREGRRDKARHWSFRLLNLFLSASQGLAEASNKEMKRWTASFLFVGVVLSVSGATMSSTYPNPTRPNSMLDPVQLGWWCLEAHTKL